MEAESIHIPVLKTPTKTELSRDDRLRIYALYYTARWGIDDLRLQFPSFSRRQIDYALEQRPTPQKKGHCGKHVLLNTPKRKELVQWVTSSSFNRSVPWAEIPRWLG